MFFILFFIFSSFSKQLIISPKTRNVSSNQISALQYVTNVLSVNPGEYEVENPGMENPCPEGEFSLRQIDGNVVAYIGEQVLISDIRGEKNSFSLFESGCNHQITVTIKDKVVLRTKTQTCGSVTYTFRNEVRFKADQIEQISVSKKNNKETLNLHCLLQRQKE